jgi:hypothetical protein
MEIEAISHTILTGVLHASSNKMELLNRVRSFPEVDRSTVRHHFNLVWPEFVVKRDPVPLSWLGFGGEWCGALPASPWADP